MKYLSFLAAILLAIVILPPDTWGQKRNGKKKLTRPAIKKTAAVRKARPRIPAVKNPLVGVMLNPSTATVVPQCAQGSENMVINIYFRDLFIQPMKYENEKFLAFRKDVALPPIVAGQTLATTNDPRWGFNFLESRDLQLIQSLHKELRPSEMQFYPKPSNGVISTIVLKRDKWYQEDVSKSYELIKAHFGVSVPTNFVSECLTLERKDANNS